MFSQSALSSSNSYRGAKTRRCNPPRGSAGGKRAAPNNDDPNPLAWEAAASPVKRPRRRAPAAAVPAADDRAAAGARPVARDESAQSAQKDMLALSRAQPTAAPYAMDPEEKPPPPRAEVEPAPAPAAAALAAAAPAAAAPPALSLIHI